jgi:hypothetical protein
MILLSEAFAQAAGRTHSPIQWVSQPLYSRLKRPWHEVDYSPPSVERDTPSRSRVISWLANEQLYI